MAKILVTGGAGYIGSHTCIELLNAGHTVIVLDNLSNSAQEALSRVEIITAQTLYFIEGDTLDAALLDHIFDQHKVDAVMHFAGSKVLEESQRLPLKYFENNIASSIKLIQAMQRAKVFRLVFSSSATVYDQTNVSPLDENMSTVVPNSNYGYSKLVVEQLLERIAIADQRWSIAVLRYFNPVGAHPSGLIGEDPKDTPNNLLPYITQVAVGRREKLAIFGHDYNTLDGTGVRDYVHVVDLAHAHVCALNYRLNTQGCRVWNIGTGQGYSVLQIKDTFEQINGVKIPYQFAARRAGDVAISFANNSRAVQELRWQPRYTLADMLADSWRWQQHNPEGYKGA